MSVVSTSNFQKGMFIEFKGEPHQIVGLEFVNPGKGSAFVRTKLKNVKSGRVQEFTYKSGESATELSVAVREMQYLYKENNKYIFMDQSTFEQTSINQELLGDYIKYLKDGQIYQIFMYEGEALGIRFPKKVRLQVTEADEGAKGNTVTGAKKTVTVETGAQITVPLFIKTGDIIVIDPETGEYVSREAQT